MTTPSILSAIVKLRSLFTRDEKVKWLGIVVFALCTSFLEVLTAGVIVVFAQALNTPETGLKYLKMAGFQADISAGRLVFYIAITVGIVYLIKNTVAAAEVFYQNFAIQKMSFKFKNKLLKRYAEADYAFYLTRNSSLGTQIIEDDAERIFSYGMVSLASILSESVIFICLIMMAVYLNPALALIIFSVGLALGLVVTKVLLPLFYRFEQKLQESNLYSGQHLIQFFHAIKEIVLLGKREAFVSAYEFHSHKKLRVKALQSTLNSLPRIVIEVLFVAAFVTTIAVLCLEKENPAQMIGILGGYLYGGFRLMPGLNRIINQLNAFKSEIPSIERVHKEWAIIGTKETYVNVPDFKFDDIITIQNMSFRHLDAKKDVLKNITLEIKKGECVGMVGETGSGKSTLVDIILGLLRPSAGSVLIDNKYPVNSYQWHEHIGYVPQAIYLTDDTIEANIAFGEQAIDTTKLNDAINAAQLSKFIKNLPLGCKTIVGERGVRLSGGERQRIAIARALYRNPTVLIFDEATSSLDNETEATLMQTIHAVSKDRTVIMIAHRLSTLKECNRIITLSDGSIKNTTPHKISA